MPREIDFRHSRVVGIDGGGGDGVDCCIRWHFAEDRVTQQFSQLVNRSLERIKFLRCLDLYSLRSTLSTDCCSLLSLSMVMKLCPISLE